MKNYPHFNELEDFLTTLEKRDLKLVLLFGSLAKGTYTQHSDIDILCVYDKKFEDRRKRFLQSYRYSDGLVQPKTITLSELKENLLKGNSFLHHLFDEGYILYNIISEKQLRKWREKGKKKVNVTYLPPS
ncbi:MAG: nucleotidyltransferase domain-containing protein [Promethearchaeia archaeon]